MLKYSQFVLLLSSFTSKCLSTDPLMEDVLITTKTFMFWPNATVPFYINPDHFDHEQALAILTSLSTFAFKTCLKFAPVMSSPEEHQHVMTFINPEGIRRCRLQTQGHSSFSPHLILLGYECLQSPEIDMIIMRALGFPFEHNRMSRDVYIDVMIQNVEPSYIELFTKENILPPVLRALPYDINSVMHFGERDYSKNGHRTILFKNNKVRQNRIGLSPTDLKKIEVVYGTECQARERKLKIELCQSYPAVRRKREIDEPPANRSLRVNPNITPPPAILEDENVEKSQVLAEDITDTGSEDITESLNTLDIAKTDEMTERIYKNTSIKLKNAKKLNLESSPTDFEHKNDKKDPSRRFFKKRRYRIQNPRGSSEMDWEDSGLTLEINQENTNKETKQGEVENGEDKKIKTDSEKTIKQVTNQKDSSLFKAKPDGKEINDYVIQGNVIQENIAESKDSELDEEKSVEEGDGETVETTMQKRKRHKTVSGEIDHQGIKLKYQGKNRVNRIKLRSMVPKTVKLNQLNKEFYEDRIWPDGIVRYVIKELPGYDLEDLRNRLSEVNRILLKKTCVQLHEVDDSEEADGYDDCIILNNSSDYVTGRVGGKQIFGCVELFEGNQHRQHTAMMVMAMLGFYFEVSRHDRDLYIRVHNRHVRPDKLHHFEKIREEATLNLPYDYKSATHPAWRFWRKIGRTNIATVATYKEQDPDGSIMQALGQNPELLSEYDIIKINSLYGVKCFQNKYALRKRKKGRRQRTKHGDYKQ